ncbi:MAG: hypothetical protein C4589_08270 [Peptococcaceae bacterium]|nr:MAG: hypothetical protein C4589_08270 [Peptococcaceae bacterium]
MKKGKVVLFSFSAVIFVAMTLAGLSPENSDAERLKKFSSYEELARHIETSVAKFEVRYQRSMPEIAAAPATGLTLDDSAGQAMEKAPDSAAVDFSTTNVQVAGVDEADIVKSDGKYLYLVSGKKVVIVEAYPPEEAKITAEIPFFPDLAGARNLPGGAKAAAEIGLEGEPCGIFINQDRMTVFVRRWSPRELLEVKVYDVADRANPVLKREVSVNGDYVNSRMIGDYVYVVAGVPINLPGPVGYPGGKVNLPEIVVDGRAGTIAATEVYYFDYPDYAYRYTVMLSLNIQDEGGEVTTKTFLTGVTQNIFVSRDNVYLTGWKMPEVQPLWDGTGRMVLPPPGEFREVGKTVVHKLSIADGGIEYKSRGEVPGRVLNQFSMDEHRGFFRIATTADGFGVEGTTRINNIYVLDGKMNMAGRLEGLAPGERIYAARFMGDRAYLVTFRQVDPLFVVDLKDPYNPKVLGELKIPGYSDYLHPYDENHLIGVGREVAAVPLPEPLMESRGGAQPSVAIAPPPVRPQGVKIALFDVSDPGKPKEMAKYAVDKEWSDSLALRDHKAFLFSRAKNLLVLPISYTMLPANFDGRVSAPYFRNWRGAYVFDISLDGGIALRGQVEHGEDGAVYMQKAGHAASSEVRRSLYIDRVLYTISDRMVKMNDLESLETINQMVLQ